MACTSLMPSPCTPPGVSPYERGMGMRLGLSEVKMAVLMIAKHVGSFLIANVILALEREKGTQQKAPAGY